MSPWSPLLSHHFLKIYAQKIGKKVDTITPSAMESLTTARWVGNVRELENCIEAKKLALRAFERRSLSALLEKSAGNVSSRALRGPRESIARTSASSSSSTKSAVAP